MKLGNLEVTLKNVHTFQGLEGYGLNADVYVNGVKTLHFHDSGDGGGGWPNGIFNNGLYELLEAEIKKHPKIAYDYGENFKGEMDYCLETLVDEICTELERAKANKKIAKLCETAIVWGVPDGDSYRYINYKRNLNTIPKDILAREIKEKVKLQEGEVIFNTNI